jgi:Domain of unknown function (DUF4342)
LLTKRNILGCACVVHLEEQIVNFQRVVEEIQVKGSNLVEKVKELIHEGNVQRIIIKNEQGLTLVEIPVTLAAIGLIGAPVLAAVGAIAGIVTKCTLVVVRREPPVEPPPAP